MDLRKLQRTVIDALEDVKAQDIRVFDTAGLTSLFDRVIIASGTSNRQTRALANNVHEAVKKAGGTVVSTEGEDTGEWVLVDLGEIVVHIMQPAIRQYYHLEEVWGGKSVRVKLQSAAVGLVKASEGAGAHNPFKPLGHEDDLIDEKPRAARSTPRGRAMSATPGRAPRPSTRTSVAKPRVRSKV